MHHSAMPVTSVFTRQRVYFMVGLMTGLCFLWLLLTEKTLAAEAKKDGLDIEQSNTKPFKTRKISIMSGTGFFVSKEGYLITNEHVVRKCKYVNIKGPVKLAKAEVVSLDPSQDLALLKTDIQPPSVAVLRRDNQYEKGQPVTVFGYPLEAGARGQYVMRVSEIVDTVGPSGENNWVQFQDSVKQGNSGGPLLDGTGNVVGVVRGKARFYEFVIDPSKSESEQLESRGPVKTSDIAINLSMLKKFLARNYVVFNETWHTNYQESPKALENKVKSFVVNVHCVL